MECNLCAELFDGAERLPKVLPCGHTACLQCLRRLPDRGCPTCRRDFHGPTEELPSNFFLLQLLQGARLHSTPRAWCSDCRAAATPRCWEEHDVLPVRRALRRHLQGAMPQAAEQLQGLQDQFPDEEALPALTLLTGGQSWDVTLRGGGRQLTGTLRNAEEPLTKALCLLLASRAALTEDRAEDTPLAAAPLSSAVAPLPPAAAPVPPAAAPLPLAAAPLPPAATPLPLAAGPLPPAAAGRAAPTESQPPRQQDVPLISRKGPDALQQEERAADVPDARGARLVAVAFNIDLQLLQLVAPTVEVLSLYSPRGAHLRAAHSLPRLRRLYVWCGDRALDVQPPVLPALPPGHAGLQWLSVRGLPRATTQSLLRAHAHSLEELTLTVGTPGDKDWPWSCCDLHSLLKQCGLRALWRIVLRRGKKTHRKTPCNEQRDRLRRVLPRTEVLCSSCDGVEDEDA
ncbi:uncharacterized protein LOC113214794 [Frankliniella occidentalis]|uniref:Uncharacterized protein LOC113214794 n=1 Tax=Frankliniella occidentalis TaxID=133901 RepID=A0A6J1TGU0_FRAOC|nr:uncharacterized protein LOC113214794 [Frankliniella occidentalis]XP_026290058.2 uncharacterized protein LOC113214794 [Frankliniella occidentalis]